MWVFVSFLKYSFFLGGYFNNSNQSEFIREAILEYCQKVSTGFNSFMAEALSYREQSIDLLIDLLCKLMD